MATKNQKTKPETKNKTSKSDVRIGEISYTKEDVIFIANKFLFFGLNLGSIFEKMKEESICKVFADANDLQMQERVQKLFKEKEKNVDSEDILKKLDTIDKIQVAVKYPDVFQLSIIEKVK